MKRTSVLFIPIATAVLLLTGCARSLHVRQEQANTISRQAYDTLKSLKLFRVPIVNVSDKAIIKARQQFAEMEKGQLEEMKRKFAPTITDTTINGVHTCIVTPQNIKPENKDKIIIYIHGGGFVMGSATDRTGMLMANELGYKMYAIDYQLAPEAKFPVAMNECLEVYGYLVTKYDPENIVGVSTSAGSTHMLAMLLKAKENGLPMIRAISLLSPGAELDYKGDSYFSNDGRDLLAYRNMGDKMMIKPFVGNAPLSDPLVSPINATFSSDFPATSIVTGTRDVFLSASSRLYWKLKDAGVHTELLCSEGMWHAFTNFTDIPEAVQARKATQQFLVDELSAKETKQEKTDNRAKTNKAVVLRFVDEVINNKRFGLIDELWSKNMVWHGGSAGDVYGIEDYKKMLIGAAGNSFSDMLLQIKDIIATDDKVVLYFSNSGKNVGDFMGNKATNKTAIWDGMGIYRLENGKIAEAWFTEDILGMFRQLGFIKDQDNH
ncbi:MAG: alpha/beta hydrolase fold domain-containing protein [Breznakibacter sp.]